MNLRDYIAYGDYSQKLKRKVIKKSAKFWFELYQLNFLNGDPNIVNILIRFNRDNQENFELALVDVDNIRWLPFIPQKMIIKNLIKFNAHTYSNLDDYGRDKLSHEDRILFFKEFFSYCNWQINVDGMIEYIIQQTTNILDNWGKKELVMDEEELNDFYI